MLPNMFNRGAMHAKEACGAALVYPVVAEQEELLRPFDRMQGCFIRGSESWTTALKRFNQTFGVSTSGASFASFAIAKAT
jgi:hypothetical protein